LKFQKQVCSVYPDAVVVKDSHNYGSQNSNLNFIILKAIPLEFLTTIINNEVVLDFPHIRNKIQIHPLSTWQENAKDAWQNAWEVIEKKLAVKLSS
jgi:hypothetical protein